MKITLGKKVFIAIGLVLIMVEVSIAGGFTINLESVSINGIKGSLLCKPEETVLMTYNVDSDYSFSGGSDKYEYFIFRLRRRIRINNSVGLGGENNVNDVKQIQQAFHDLGHYTGSINGICDNTLIQIIKDFQKAFLFIKYPDGRIDPNGVTIRNIPTKSTLFVQFARDFSVENFIRPINYSVQFTSPKEPGEYDIEYSQTPYFSKVKFEEVDQKFVKLSKTDEADLLNYINSTGGKFFFIGNIKITNSISASNNIFPGVYLKVNNKTPGRAPLITNYISEEPIKFHWYTSDKSKQKDLMFRYRLFPDEEWTEWTDSTSAYYYFINKGQHEFKVQCKRKSSETETTAEISYSFLLEKPFVANPVTKGVIYASVSPAPQNLKTIYANSRALLIGVPKFKDLNFSILPYIENDIKGMEEALRLNGFKDIDVVTPKNVTRDVIISKLDSIVNISQPNDRIVVYVSSHGFADRIDPSQGYIACYDCNQSSPSLHCVSLKNLQDIIERGRIKGIKHILLIVDSCFSGLGVITKDSAFPAIGVVASKAGTHMMTAGMENQLAQMPHNLRMSTFTYYLHKGLTTAEADVMKDNVVTLSELLLYVQYNVAKETNGQQIPMLGRVSGAGEIIFFK